MPENWPLREKIISWKMEMSFSSGLMFRKRGRRVLPLILFVCFFLPSSGIPAQDTTVRNKPADILARASSILEKRGEIVFEFRTEDITEIKKINSIVSVDRETEYGYEAYANKSGFKDFLELGIPFRLIEREERKKSSTAAGNFPGDWNVYPTHIQYTGFMEKIAADYPGICRLDTIGQSVEGRNILVLKLSDNPGMHEPEPGFVYSSTMHGDETTGYVLLLRLIDHLASNYGKDTTVTRLIDNLQIWINPLANPDGTYWQGDDKLSLPKRFNANNADLNRNFPGIRDSKHPDFMEYQPENLAQMKFLRSINMVLGANIHGGEEVINYPFDTWEFLHADDKWYKDISMEYASLAQQRSYPVLYMSGFKDGITNGWEWYEVEGSRQDWVNYFNHAREITIEISLAKDPPPEDLPYYWHYNYPSMIRLMEHSLTGIQGIIREEGSGKPLKASVWVDGHDELHSNIFSDSLTGFFARPIQTGTYDLEISMSGYESKFIRDVEVETEGLTWREIELVPVNTLIPENMWINVSPNPFWYGTEIRFDVLQSGRYSILVYDMNGRLVLHDHRNFFSGEEGIYNLEGRDINHGIYLLKIISPGGTRSVKIFKSE
jgi:hypothetical protein